MTDPNPEYWTEYSNLQHVKHELIRNYLNGWFPKLGSWAGRILYVDTHAGRGKHLRGQLGSPLVALTTLMEHAHKDRLLRRSEVVFMFVERDAANLRQLETEIEQFGSLPRNVMVHAVEADCFDFLNNLIEFFHEPDRKLAPAFIFVDPYGFKIPGSILRELMSFKRVELFITVMWRELDMAIAQGDASPGLARTLDLIFDAEDWRKRITSPNPDERAEDAVSLFKELTEARWATRVRMVGDNNRTRYLLLHLTNHDAGRELMKDCVWKVCPHGGFYVRKSDDPSQEYLIMPEPNLDPLCQWLLTKLAERPRRWHDLLEDLRAEVWRAPHLTKVIRQLRQEGVIDADSYEGRFGQKSNPRLFLPQADNPGNEV